MADGMVCPAKILSGLFTVETVDNLDHKPCSTTWKDSFHGTSISLMKFPTLECPGQDIGETAREIAPLPEECNYYVASFIENTRIHCSSYFKKCKTH